MTTTSVNDDTTQDVDTTEADTSSAPIDATVIDATLGQGDTSITLGQGDTNSITLGQEPAPNGSIYRLWL